MNETLEQMAERLAGQMFEAPSADTLRHNAGLILATLREVKEEFDLRARELGRKDMSKPRLRFSLEEGASTDKRPLSPKETETYERLRQTWAKRLDRISEAAEGSERLTAQDYAVRINALPSWSARRSNSSLKVSK